MRDNEIRAKDNEIAHLKEELERAIRKNRELEDDNRHLEQLVQENITNNQKNPPR